MDPSINTKHDWPYKDFSSDTVSTSVGRPERQSAVAAFAHRHDSATIGLPSAWPMAIGALDGIVFKTQKLAIWGMLQWWRLHRCSYHTQSICHRESQRAWIHSGEYQFAMCMLLNTSLGTVHWFLKGYHIVLLLVATKEEEDSYVTSSVPSHPHRWPA